MQIETDILIIGSGAAGLSLALRLADTHTISLISKASLREGSTLYAQGGIAAVLASDDSIESHIADTINAGAGLCDPDVVRFTVAHGPENIQWLLEQGVHFTTDKKHGNFHLTREGGHSHRRIVHATDATGHAIEINLSRRVREHPRIACYENHIAVDLITRRKLGATPNHCVGAYVLDKDTNEVQVFRAGHVVLATGGASKVYLYTSNPDTSTGDGIAMAWRAGCRVANLEFNQFHPTCLYHPKAKSFLITEA
ncbi:MAG TPA: FAD-binding protein, partial [Chromatiales bacterium]|nr:FAD-binding protein [Chromatiales bacterium]